MMQTTVQFEDLAKKIATCRDKFLHCGNEPSADIYRQFWRGQEMGMRAIVGLLIGGDAVISVFHDLDEWSITVKISGHEFVFDCSEW